MEPNQGVEVGEVRVLLNRVGVRPWELWAMKRPEYSIGMKPWELAVLASSSSTVLAHRRYRSKHAAQEARRKVLVAAGVGDVVVGSPERVQAMLDET